MWTEVFSVLTFSNLAAILKTNTQAALVPSLESGKIPHLAPAGQRAQAVAPSGPGLSTAPQSPPSPLGSSA